MMNRKTIVASLIQVANNLDENGLTPEADSITKIASRLAQFEGHLEGPDDYRADHGFLGEDNHEMMQELAKSEAIERIRAIQANPNPSPDEQQELKELTDWIHGISQKMDQGGFAQTLSAAGAEVVGKDATNPFSNE